MDAGARCLEHAQLVDEATMRLVVKKGVFIAPFLTAINPRLLEHPVYGDESSPVYPKVRAFMEGAKDFPELVRRHRPKWVLATDIVFSPAQLLPATHGSREARRRRVVRQPRGAGRDDFAARESSPVSRGGTTPTRVGSA